jgi:hypothetical protein
MAGFPESEATMVTTTGLIEVERQGDTLVLTPHRDLRELDYSEFWEEPEEVLGLLASNPTLRDLVVDFGQTDHLGSMAFTLFTRLGQEVRAATAIWPSATSPPMRIKTSRWRG